MTLGNGKNKLGIIFGTKRTHFLAVQGSQLVHRQILDQAWPELALDPARDEFLQAAAKLKQLAGGKGAEVYLCLRSGLAALHQIILPEKKGGLFFPEPDLALEKLTPLPPDEVHYALRRLEGAKGSHSQPAQAALVRKEITEGIAGLAAQSGLKARALDLQAGYAALAGVNLAGEAADGIFILMDAHSLHWSRWQGGRPGLIGSQAPRQGETPAQAAARAAQHAIQVCGLSGSAPVYLAGPQAEQVAAQLIGEPSGGGGGGVELIPHVLTPGPSAPQGLDWEELALYGFLKQGPGGDKTLFNLLPRAGGSSRLSSRRTTRMLAWAAVILVCLIGSQAGLEAWWDHYRINSRLDQARSELKQINSERKKLRLAGKRLAALDRADRAQGEAQEIIGQVAARLPQSAWLERLEYGTNACTVYVGGLAKNRAGALFPEKGRLKVAGPVKQVTAPGSGRPAVKLVLQLDQGKKTAKPTSKRTSSRPKRTLAPRTKRLGR